MPSRLDARVSAALAALAPRVSGLARSGPRGWRFSLAGGAMRVGARLEDAWVLLRSPLRAETLHRRGWSLLRSHSGLPASTRFGIAPDGRAFVLADVPLDEDVELGSRLREACLGIEAARSVTRAASPVSDPAPCASAPPAGREPSSCADLGALCAEAGWPCSSRAAGSLAVDLDVPGLFLQATVAPGDGSAVRVSAELARLDALAGVGRDAVARLLLAVGQGLRLARATIREEDGGVAVGFEVRFESRPSGAELDHALSSLSLAARLCAREVHALGEERIARAYVALLAAASHRRRSTVHGNHHEEEDGHEYGRVAHRA